MPSTWRPRKIASVQIGTSVSGFVSQVAAIAAATLARHTIATTAASSICVGSGITPTASPSAAPSATRRRCATHSQGRSRR